MAGINEFQLINLVNLKPEVWDSNSVLFRNKIVKAAAWKEIAASLGNTVDECQSTWKKLRDRYTRTKRMLPSGSEGGRKSWDKEEYMRFLDKVLVSRKTTSSAAADLNLSSHTPGIECIVNDAATAEFVALDDSLGNLEFDGEPNQELEDTVVLVDIEEDATADVHMNVADYEEASTSSSAASSGPPVPAPAPPSSKNVAPRRQKGTKRKSSNANGNPEVAASLINAINKLSDAPDQIAAPAEPELNAEFLKYHVAQIKNLLKNKSNIMQRRIRNRLSSFVDELYEELNE